MVNIISDDIYFSLGLSEILNQQGIENSIIHIDSMSGVEQEKQCNDIVFLCAGNNGIALKMINMACAMSSNVILVLDMLPVNTVSNAWQCEIISKKISFDLINEFSTDISNVKKLIRPTLTKKELMVMSALSKGITMAKLSGDMCLSRKTISSHKINGLKKLGLNPRNIHSLAIYREMFQRGF